MKFRPSNLHRPTRMKSVLLFCLLLNAHANLYVEVPIWSLRVASATSPTTADLFFRLDPGETGPSRGHLTTYITLDLDPTTPRNAASWSAPDPLTP